VGHSFAFGPFQVVPAERLLLREGRAVPLAPKLFDVLAVLVRRGGCLVSNEELLATVWKGAFVEAGSVTRTVSLLRQALGAEGRAIETVHGHGYRLAVQVHEESSGQGTVVAVLPFTWLGEPAEDGEASTLGLADSLAARLSAANGFRVRPLSSVLALRDLARDPLAAGSRLGCDLVVEGRLQRMGSSVRVTAHAVRVEDGSSAWAATVDGRWPNLFALQDALAAQVLGRLGAGETSHRTRRIRETSHPEAYRLYLKGRYVHNHMRADGFADAVDSLRRATELDPAFAAAHAALADLYLMSIGAQHRAADLLPLARRAARRAVELDPHLAEAWTSLGVLHFWHDWERTAAEDDFRRALEADADYAMGHHTYAWFLLASDRCDEAELELARTRRLDPLGVMITADLGLPHYFRGDYRRAADAYRAALELEPEFWYSHHRLGEALLELGELDGALRAFTAATDGVCVGAAGRLGLARAHVRAGNRELGRALLAAAMADSSLPPQHYFAAGVHAELGDRARAFEALEAACEERDKWLGWLMVDPALATLHGDPRWAGIARAAGFAPSRRLAATAS
jgi:DNA-binding winged helix-turn-helix (wHTH) protein/tetratricopeptide (TPR) repeat protein